MYIHRVLSARLVTVGCEVDVVFCDCEATVYRVAQKSGSNTQHFDEPKPHYVTSSFNNVKHHPVVM